MTATISKEPFGEFNATTQGPRLDYSLEVFYQYNKKTGHNMVIGTPDGPIYITEKQAIAFFGWLGM